MTGDKDHVSNTRLTSNYPNTFSDFYGGGRPCIFKSGPEWPVRKGPQAQGIVREPRLVQPHAIQPSWISIGMSICDKLESIGVFWTTVDPLAYANAGESKPFCPFIISVGVNLGSLPYKVAVDTTAVVKKILTDAGFSDIEVAFVESVVTRSMGPKLLSFNPLVDKVPDLRKPFTPTLGLSIASRKYPYYAKDNNHVALLTCAHVARPPPAYANTGMTYKQDSQRREEVVALSTMAFDNAVKAMMATICDHLQSIDTWNDALLRLGEPTERESMDMTESRNEYLELVEKATKEIERVKKLHSEATENYTTLDQHKVGFVLHSSKIEVAIKLYKFTQDWALIELYNDKIDWETFKGNKVWVGGKLSISKYENTMFPQPQNRKNYSYPKDGLLQAFDFIQEAEMRDPQHLDTHGEKCLIVVKNGFATGTMVGRVNRLESFKRVYEKYSISKKSLEIVVLSYDRAHGKFSNAGDLGSIILDKGGCIVGILTGGVGPTEETDITYLTPYWWVEQQIKAKFPGIALYDVVE